MTDDQAKRGRPDGSACDQAEGAGGPAADLIHIFDLHCDTLGWLVGLGSGKAFDDIEPADLPDLVCVDGVSLYQNELHVSLARTQRLGWAQCFAVFTPESLTGQAGLEYYRFVRRIMQGQLDDYAGLISQVRTVAEAEAATASGRCAALLSIEGAALLNDSLAPLDELAADGVRLLSLTWNHANGLAGGVLDQGGLTSHGRQAVRALEERRIVIDVSHLNDQSFAELDAIASRPFIASHSNARAVCPHPRNLTDSQFAAICERGGIVGLNFHNAFLREDGREASPDDLLRHLDHWLGLDGAAAIALGSDYDGAEVASWLTPCDEVATLYEHVSRAFSPELADRLFWQNARDFFSTAEL